MARRLTDKEKKKIIADYVETGNYSETSRRNKVSWTTVKNVVSTDDSSVRKLEQKKEENTQDMLEYLSGNMKKAQTVIDLCLDTLADPEKIKAAQPQQISTVMGTVIDKFAPISSLPGKDEGIYRLDNLLIADGFQSVRRDVINHNHTEYVFPGGRGSTKSSFVSMAIVELLKNNPQCHALAIRQVSNTLKDSVNSQIKWAIREQGLEAEFDYKTVPLEIILKDTKQKIYFRGADDPLKIKSIKPEFGYIGIVWFEELDQFKGEEPIRSIEQSAIRGGDSAWIFKSFNPPKTKDNWANKYITIPKEKRLVHHSTYLDAQVPPEWLGKTFLEEAEFLKEVNPTAYEHEYLGVPNGSGGNVFDNVNIRTITEGERRTFDRIYMGIDWGWYPDPFQWGKMHFDANRRKLYILDEYRTNKTSNLDTWNYLVEKKGVTFNDLITADSAEPKSVSDYRSYGARCRGAEKGPGSVDYSMKWLQSLSEIIIDQSTCPHTASEFINYEYERDKDGNVISGYPDRDNHAIDCCRYALEPVWKRKGR